MNSRKAAVLLTIAAIAFMLYLFRRRIVDAWKKATEKLTPDSAAGGSGGADGHDTRGGSSDADGAAGSGGGSNDSDCAECGASSPLSSDNMLDSTLNPPQGQQVYRLLFKGIDGDNAKIRDASGSTIILHGVISFTVKIRQADDKPLDEPRPRYRVVAEVRQVGSEELHAKIVSEAFNFSVLNGEFPTHSFTVRKRTTESGQEIDDYIRAGSKYHVIAWVINAETGEQISDSVTSFTARTGATPHIDRRTSTT